jgi:hypothetical protein
MFAFAAGNMERAAARLAFSSLLLLLEFPMSGPLCLAAVLFAVCVALWHGWAALAPEDPASPVLGTEAMKPKVAGDESQSDAETESTMGSDPATSETERGAWDDSSDCCSSDEEEGTVGMSLPTIVTGCPCPPGLCRCPGAPAWPLSPKAAGDTSQSDAETESTMGGDLISSETGRISESDFSGWCCSDTDEDAALFTRPSITAGCPCPPGLCRCHEALARQQWRSVATRMASLFREEAAFELGSPSALESVHRRRHHAASRVARGGAHGPQPWATVGIRLGAIFREVAASEL